MSGQTTHEVLVKARNIIDRRGWWDGTGKSCYGECVITAIVKSERSRSQVVRDRFAEAAGSGARADFLDIWNDAEGRTKDEVLAAFDRAIAVEESVLS